MRKFGRSLAFGFVGMALAAVGVATPAAAVSPKADAVAGGDISVSASGSTPGQVVIHKRGDGVKPPAELGNPSEWGVVNIDMSDSAGSASSLANACQEPGSGGTWCYGWKKVPGGKRCYSNYLHGTKWHSSSVIVLSEIYRSGSRAPGEIANASNGSVGLAYTCAAYYSVD